MPLPSRPRLVLKCAGWLKQLVRKRSVSCPAPKSGARSLECAAVAERMIRTFLDANVLVSAGKGTRRDAEAAFRILEQSNRIFLVSPFLRLEILPHAQREKKWVRVMFYEQYFARAEPFHAAPAPV